MPDWCDQIEPGVRDLVRLLRDNGVNTTSSCEGHDAAKGLEVEADLMLDGEIQRIHNLLYDNGYRNYKITVEVIVHEGKVLPWLIISVEKEEGVTNDEIHYVVARAESLRSFGDLKIQFDGMAAECIKRGKVIEQLLEVVEGYVRLNSCGCYPVKHAPGCLLVAAQAALDAAGRMK